MAHFTIGSLQKRGTPDYKKRNVTGPGVSLLGLGCLPSEAGISASLPITQTSAPNLSHQNK